MYWEFIQKLYWRAPSLLYLIYDIIVSVSFEIILENLWFNKPYSFSLIRSPEEAMFHIIHEAKRTVPSVLYIPHLLRLWRNVLTPPQREAFMALLSEIQPTAPLIIIAFTGM